MSVHRQPADGRSRPTTPRRGCGQCDVWEAVPPWAQRRRGVRGPQPSTGPEMHFCHPLDAHSVLQLCDQHTCLNTREEGITSCLLTHSSPGRDGADGCPVRRPRQHCCSSPRRASSPAAVRPRRRLLGPPRQPCSEVTSRRRRPARPRHPRRGRRERDPAPRTARTGRPARRSGSTRASGPSTAPLRPCGTPSPTPTATRSPPPSRCTTPPPTLPSAPRRVRA